MPFDGQNLTDVQRVLLKAAGIVRERWGRGTVFVRPPSTRCAVQAIAEASGAKSCAWSTDGLDLPATAALQKHLGFPHAEYICGWNDLPTMTAEQVTQALEAAAMKGGE